MSSNSSITRRRKRLKSYLAREMDMFLQWSIKPENASKTTEELANEYVEQIASHNFLPLVDKIIMDRIHIKIR
jgi:hypothetical protein